MNELVKTETPQVVNIEFNQEAKTLIKATLLPGCTDIEMDLFCMVCKRTRLDPFQKQITAFVGADDYGNRKLTFVTTIDGYRGIAERSGFYEGQTPPAWCGENGKWMDVWLSDKPPSAAKVGIYRKGAREAIWGVARFSTFAKYKKGKDGSPYLIKNWKNMPDHMLAKVAEAQGLRKAFSNDMSGIYTFDEVEGSDDLQPASTKGVHEYKQPEAPKILPKPTVLSESPTDPQPSPEPENQANAASLQEQLDSFIGIMEFNNISVEKVMDVLKKAKLATTEKTLRELQPHVIQKITSEKWTNRIVEMFELEASTVKEGAK